MYFSISNVSVLRKDFYSACLIGKLFRPSKPAFRLRSLFGPKTKTPSITMGFCFLGGNISGFEVQSERAVMLGD